MGSGSSEDQSGLPKIPVQPLQVEKPLRQLAVPRLLHPRHAIDALHQAAGSPHHAEHRGQATRLFGPTWARLTQKNAARGPMPKLA